MVIEITLLIMENHGIVILNFCGNPVLRKQPIQYPVCALRACPLIRLNMVFVCFGVLFCDCAVFVHVVYVFVFCCFISTSLLGRTLRLKQCLMFQLATLFCSNILFWLLKYLGVLG